MLGNATATLAFAVRLTELTSRGELTDALAALAKTWAADRVRETVALGREIAGAEGIRVDHDLAIMKPGQDLYHVTTETMTKLRDVLREERPDVTLTQGDTSTAFASSLASFYEKIPVAHE
jgi:hypothetical protein